MSEPMSCPKCGSANFPKTCPHCLGVGMEYNSPESCRTCHGEYYFDCPICEFKGTRSSLKEKQSDLLKCPHRDDVKECSKASICEEKCDEDFEAGFAELFDSEKEEGS